MDGKIWLAVLVVSWSWYGPCTGATAATGESSQPNIILILADDLGFSDLGCYGGEIQTPHLDGLARDGMRFTQFYNNAKCTTTRASLMTGLYPRGKNGNRHLRTNMLTLGEALKRCGYATALCGKWHLGRGPANHPSHRGFEFVYGLLDGCCNFFDPARPDPDYKGGRIRYFTENRERILEFPEGFYTTDAFTDRAIDWIRSTSRKGKPFFLHLAYTAPHYPLHAKPADWQKYVGRYRQGWDSLRRDRFQRQQELGLATDAWRLSPGDQRAYAWDQANHEFEDQRMAVYAGMVDCLDQNIGRLIQVLRECDQDHNTLILFMSDNGGCAEEPGGRDPAVRRPGPVDDYVAVGPSWGWAQNSPFRRYKSWLQEGGIATPMIAWWPGKIPANSINREVAHIIDLMPTCLDLAGGEYPTLSNEVTLLPLEGSSMAAMLTGQPRQLTRSLCWHWAGNRAVRKGDWKLVWDRLDPEPHWHLYDLSRDRCELEDLADQDPQRVQQMMQIWIEWARQMELIKSLE